MQCNLSNTNITRFNYTFKALNSQSSFSDEICCFPLRDFHIEKKYLLSNFCVKFIF